VASIEKRTRNGKVTYRVRYRSPDGRQRSKVFDRSIDAKRWLHGTEHAKDTGRYVDQARAKVPFDKAAERWHATTTGLAPTSRRDYRMLLDHQVLPFFGTTPVGAIDDVMVKEWLASMATTGLSAKRRRAAHGVLRLVLGFAGLGRNVASEVKAPKVQKRERVILTAEQVEALAAAITPPFGTLVRFAAWTGLRPEETTALRLRHLDPLHGTVRVAEAAPLLEGRLVFGPCKTHEARTIHLPGFLQLELEGYLEARGSLGPDAFLFTMPRGGPLRENRFVADHLKPALRRAGLPPMRAYDLRHTAASLAIRAGANVLTVSKLLGHAKPSITLDTYADLFGDELEALAKVLDRAHASRGPNVAPAVVPLSKGVGQ
jgi:integrase